MRIIRRIELVIVVAGLAAIGLACAVQNGEAKKTTTDSYNQFIPGEIWLDTDGNLINAHGGGILYVNGVYFWYGEIKEGETYLPACNSSWGGTRVDVVGVSCYSSKDLYNWKYEGNVLPASSDPSSDLYTKKVVERPKVIYNAETKKYVMWMHIDSMDYAEAKSGVAVSDSPTGPFAYIGSFRPDAGVWPINITDEEKEETNQPLVRDFNGGQMARDMTLFIDDDGKAYQFYSSEENQTMHISELTDDYLSPSGKYMRVFIGRSMEAPAVFKHNGKYYFIASGCTGWDPNAARSAVADSIWGLWEELSNPCQGVNADKTFFGQSTFVLPVQGKKDTYIFVADRWNKDDLKESRYIWLPIKFDQQGKIVIEWQDKWSLD